MMKNPNEIVRGVSISPLTDTIDSYLLNPKLDKEVKFDWFQATFDFIRVYKVGNKNIYAFDRDKLFKELLDVLKRKELPYELQNTQGKTFGYNHGLQIDEHIWFLWGGKKTKYETYPCQLIISGQGCRVFEEMGGNWNELFTYFEKNKTTHLKYGRLDLAIDDFTGDEITPYDLEKYFRNKWFISPFRKMKWNYDFDITGESPTASSYAWTFGTKGSNQLQIYDKALERKANDYFVTIETWYRYEMRFVEEKAQQVISLYIQAIKDNKSFDFMQFTKRLLLSLLDVKTPSKTDTNRSRWKTLTAWQKFCDSLDKIDLKSKNKSETTIAKKLIWFKKDMATTLLEHYAIFGHEFFIEFMDIMAQAKFELKHLNRINNYFRNLGKKEMTLDEFETLKESFKKMIEEQNYKNNITESSDDNKKSKKEKIKNDWI